MGLITLNSNKTGKSYSYEAKHDLNYYKKYHPFSYQITGFLPSYEEIIYRHFRYTNFIDHNNLVADNNAIMLANLRRKRPTYFHRLPFADHTTYYKEKGNLFPQIMVTEPYHIKNEIPEIEEFLNVNGWEYKILEPSPKSLWYQSEDCLFATKYDDLYTNFHSWMIFIWDKNYFQPPSNFFDYDSAQEVHKRVKEQNE